MWTMNFENINPAPLASVFISLPKKYMVGLSQHYDLDHGLCITELKPNISEKHLCAYFNQWGKITMCNIKVCAYVIFSREEEADRADLAGPHYIGGTECKVRRIVSLKDKVNDEAIPLQTNNATRQRPMSLSNTLEDPQLLNEDC